MNQLINYYQNKIIPLKVEIILEENGFQKMCLWFDIISLSLLSNANYYTILKIAKGDK